MTDALSPTPGPDPRICDCDDLQELAPLSTESTWITGVDLTLDPDLPITYPNPCDGDGNEGTGNWADIGVGCRRCGSVHVTNTTLTFGTLTFELVR